MAPLQIYEKILEISPGDMYGGHVKYAKYFSYISEAFDGWYEGMGLLKEVGPLTGPLMAHLGLDFQHELRYPGRVLCRLIVVRLGRSSLEHSVELRDADHPEVLCGKGTAVNVWFDRDIGNVAPWPTEIAARCWSSS